MKQEEIDGLMKMMPTLPKSFGDWMMTTPFTGISYMFYKKINKVMYGLCSKCGELEAFKSNKKHNDTGRCNNCNSKVTFKAINKAKTYQDIEFTSIIQKLGDGYVVRYFKVRRFFKTYEDSTENFPEVILDRLKNPTFDYYEGSRVYICFNNRSRSQYHYFEEVWSHKINDNRWVNERTRSSFMNKELIRIENPVLYKRNLKSVLKDSPWKYCGLNFFKGKHMNIDDYLCAYEKYPSLEMLCKLNYKTLMNQVIYRANRWGSVDGLLKMNEKRLGLSAKSFNLARKLDLNISGVEFIHTLEERGRKLDDGHIKWVLKYVNPEVFVQLLKWITPQKAINYISKNTKALTRSGETVYYPNRYNFATTWRDYLNMCEKLKLDLKSDFVLFPKNLEEKHDEYSELIKEKVAEERDQKIKFQYEKWNKILCFKSGQLNIEVAGNHESIIHEGQSQRHCVGNAGYSRDMAEGKILIMFIRKNGAPYYTVEFNQNNLEVKQNRGFKNKDVNKEVEKFMKKWETKVLMNLSKPTELAM